MDSLLYRELYKIVASPSDRFGFVNKSGRYRVMFPDGTIYKSNRTFTSATKTVYVYNEDEDRWETPKGRPATLLKGLEPTLKRALKRLQKYHNKKKSFKIKLPKGAKPTVEKTKRIDRISSRKEKRPLAEAKKIAKLLTKHLKKLGFKGVEIAGSIRRKEPIVGDIDAMAIGNLKRIQHYEPFEFIKGKEKSVTFMFKNHQVNLYAYEKKYYGSMLFFLTGPGRYNIALRKIAKKQGKKLSQYGIFDLKGNLIASKTEEDMYKALNKSYKAPELRGKKGTTKKKVPSKTPPEKISWSKLDETKYSKKDIKNYIKTLSEDQLVAILRKADKKYYNT